MRLMPWGARGPIKLAQLGPQNEDGAYSRFLIRNLQLLSCSVNSASFLNKEVLLPCAQDSVTGHRPSPFCLFYLLKNIGNHAERHDWHRSGRDALSKKCYGVHKTG